MGFNSGFKGLIYRVIQEGKVNILGGVNIGNCEEKKVHITMCLILNGYPGTAV